MQKLKDELQKGFTNYYDELNKQINDELLHQESIQKELHDKIETSEKKIKVLNSKVDKTDKYKFNFIENLIEVKSKAHIFRFLNDYNNFRKTYKNNKKMIIKIYFSNLKRKALNNIKNFSFLQKSNAYEEKLKNKTEEDLNRYEYTLRKQKEELLKLILKAEDKLKHENRKKVQAKLQLDQIVLRGISALNLQALTLSQNSLQGSDK